TPVPQDRPGTTAEDRGGFLSGESAEEAHLDHARFPLVDCRQRGERLVERHEILTAFGRDSVRLVERYLHDAAAAFLILPRAREIDQNAPHQPRAHREKMRAILPAHPAHID